MKKPKKLFETISREQNQKIHALAREIHISDERLYAMVKDLIGIASISALSKHEASFIIDQMEGSAKWLWPRPPRAEKQISGNNSNLPSFGHILGIRLIAKDLGWSRGHLKNWLKKYVKAGSIRELDREKARSAFLGMKNIQSYERERKKKAQ